MLLETGFVRGEHGACVFYVEEAKVRTVAHGDDFTVRGESKSLDWFREMIQKRMEVKLKGRLEKGRPGAVRIVNQNSHSDGERLGVRGGPEARRDDSEGPRAGAGEQGSSDTWSQ